MPCHFPLQAFYSLAYDGKKVLHFSNVRARLFEDGISSISDQTLSLPCGRCMPCRLERSRQWAVRCMHEAQLWENTCFLTLTYDPIFLPEGGSLVKKDLQDFMKRFRRSYSGKEKLLYTDSSKQMCSDFPIRYFGCGEYGDNLERPHYHLIIFNFDFQDKLFWKEVDGFRYYVSEELTSLWGKGHCVIGDVTFESAAYVARYIMKKITGKDADEFYEFIDFNTGEWYRRKPEYTTMSRRTGIGSGWFDKWAMIDAYPNDYVIIRGRKMRPPKFYDSKLGESFLEDIKSSRIEKAFEFAEDQSRERLIDREKCATAKLRLFSRSVE